MNDNILQNHLAHLHFEMNEDTLNQMVNETMEWQNIKLIPIKWLTIGLAASFALFVLVVYWQTGSLDYNSFLGIDSITSQELNNYFFYL
jgi:hypothetical protein